MKKTKFRFPLRTATPSSFYAAQNFRRNLTAAVGSIAFSVHLEFGFESELVVMEAEEGDDERGTDCGEGAQAIPIQSTPS